MRCAICGHPKRKHIGGHGVCYFKTRNPGVPGFVYGGHSVGYCKCGGFVGIA